MCHRCPIGWVGPFLRSCSLPAWQWGILSLDPAPPPHGSSMAWARTDQLLRCPNISLEPDGGDVAL